MKKRHDIDIAEVRKRLDYDQETGKFYWKVRSSRNVKAGSLAGCITPVGYRCIRLDGAGYMAHRLAWAYVHGVWPEYEIDHIDGVKDNNAIANLRDVPSKINMQNRKVATKGSNSGVLGVHWNKHAKKWRAVIVLNRKPIFLGYCDNIDDGSNAYIEAKRRIHIGCTI